ncbi:MAG: TolC family protein, partial [Gemmatimonadaceae bacterium]
MAARSRLSFAWVFALTLVPTFVASSPATAQLTGASRTKPPTAISRSDAIRLAVEHSPRTILFRADSSAAAAEFAFAKQFENPSLSASYSKSEPQAHFALDIPIDWPRARQPRINAARNSAAVASLRNAYGRRALELDVDTAYTRAQSQLARATLSRRTARDADSLLTIAKIRRDAGDASELEVELATVFAGQFLNAALADSLLEVAARVSLQTLMGLSPDSMQISLTETIPLTDSAIIEGNLVVPARSGASNNSTLLPVAVAQGDVETANLRVLAEQRRRFAAPSLSLGFETVQSGTSGPLPTVGLAMPLPFFNRNNASVQVS